MHSSTHPRLVDKRLRASSSNLLFGTTKHYHRRALGEWRPLAWRVAGPDFGFWHLSWPLPRLSRSKRASHSFRAITSRRTHSPQTELSSISTSSPPRPIPSAPPNTI